MSEIWELGAAEIAAKVRGKEVSAREVMDAFLDRVEVVEPQVNAFITVTREEARRMADAVDAKLAAGEDAGPLAGVPVALKDNLSTRGIETTCASKILKGYVPPFDATVVSRLAQAGAVFIGKTNLDEFAMGSSTENSGFFPTKNPWDTSRVPGGSSGGSAVAVAAQLAPVSLGSDTGGSIRQPAALCGVTGFKPTYGRVSRYGLVAFGSSLDQIGPFGWTAADAALLLNTIAGHDPLDSTSVPRPVPDYTAALTGDIKGLRIGVPAEYFAQGIAPEVRALTMSAIGVLRGLGAEVVEVSLPYTDYALAAYYIVAPAEASSNLARYDGVRFGPRAETDGKHNDLFEKTREMGFGAEVKQRIMIGTYALSAGYYDAFYLKAQKVRTLIRRDFEAAFEKCDLLATPTAPTTAFALGEKTEDPLEMKLQDILTIPVNMAGLPGISVPCGFDTRRLPVGLQLIGPAFSEEMLLRTADAYQRNTDWHTRRPTL
ncbi:MAG: Asp-tRNA(Asn)/Glu-tRNA(Gln) amidotransferase subunit GatA [Armatimonadaceae bacterium]